MAVDELPSPRRGGTAFWHSNRNGGISFSMSPSAFFVERTIRFSSVGGSVHLPSPLTTIENSSASSTTILLCMLSATLKQSKPGPKFDVVAGTVISTL